MDFTGCGNTLQHAQSARAAIDHGQPAVLDRQHARRRVPLRSGQHAGPRAARGRQAGRVLRHHPPGSGDLAGKADRRTVGLGGRRLPGRQLSGAVVGMERQVPRLHPPLLEGGRRRGLRIRHAILRIERSVRVEQPPAARQHQLRHLPRRLHAARPGVLRPQAQRSQRRGQSRRHGRQHQLELRRRRADRRRQRFGALREERSAASWPRCCSRRACRCCWPATSWATRSTATTTPTARTTRSRG